MLPSDPGDPIELTIRRYPFPFLPYSPFLLDSRHHNRSSVPPSRN